MIGLRTILVLFVPLAALCSAASEPPAKPPAEDLEFFEKKVRPLLVENCHTCHGADKQKAGLRLDSREAVLKGSDDGPILVPGEPDKSKLIDAIRYQGELKMPPKQKLPAEAVETLTAWVKLGAPWPQVKAEGGRRKDEKVGTRPLSSHWAFQPVQRPALPVVKDGTWPWTSIDHFILAQLEAHGLRPAAPADRRTLLRRLSYDVIGLPPTAEEIDAFMIDPSPDAVLKAVNRLLASPHFGERWGRYWLDVARYADERGYVGVGVDRVYPFAYTYRDWVIRAFNEDLPYDQFIIAQLAADHVVGQVSTLTGQNGQVENLSHNRRHLAAMGFLTVGRRFINNQHDVIDDRIDVVSRGFLGLTVTCARCHDHKYDPIPTADYYSLYGVFASSREPEELPLLDTNPGGPDYEAFSRELKRLEEEKAKFERDNEQMEKERPREFKEKIKPFDNRIKQLHARHPGAPGRGMVMVDRSSPPQPRVFLRGNPANPGPEVPRQFLAILEGGDRQPFQHGSGRLELAQAIASKDNPLTARVMVNRIWLHLFGQGLVRTPSDFGTRSDPPSHPELLDYLAWRFMEDGWSVKKLMRLIVLSSVYQQSSVAEGATGDPENLLLSRMTRRRLDFEALRDSLLFISGHLDSNVHGRSVDLGKAPYSRRRTMYGFIDRQNLPGMFRTFDFAGPDTHSPQRHSTTVPQQALFLMNHPFVVEQVKKLVARPEVAAAAPGDGKVQALHRLIFGRQATADDLALARDFLAKAEPSEKLSPWEQYAQVLLLSNEFVFVD
jgi:hypothetical protein